jgi:pectinesterase
MRSLLLLALGLLPAAAAQNVYLRVSPAVTTGIPGTNAFPTIQNALDLHPWPRPGGRVIIRIEPGVYHERLSITQNHPNITLLGVGKSPDDVVITNSLSAHQTVETFLTETVEVNGNGFEADNLRFENSAGENGQAVAVVVRADRVVFKHWRSRGYQDTLCADYSRQYYIDSYIEGAVDFLFGNAAAVFDHDELRVSGPGALTAPSRTSPAQTTGFVILDSRVISDIPAGKRQQIWLGARGARIPASSSSTPGRRRTWVPPGGTTGAMPATRKPPGTLSTTTSAPALTPVTASPVRTSSPPPRRRRSSHAFSSPARTAGTRSQPQLNCPERWPATAKSPKPGGFCYLARRSRAAFRGYLIHFNRLIQFPCDPCRTPRSGR